MEGVEDDGYILEHLYMPETHYTEFIILDAQVVDRGHIKLGHHILYGFHTPEVFLDTSTVSL